MTHVVDSFAHFGGHHRHPHHQLENQHDLVPLRRPKHPGLAANAERKRKCLSWSPEIHQVILYPAPGPLSPLASTPNSPTKDDLGIVNGHGHDDEFVRKELDFIQDREGGDENFEDVHLRSHRTRNGGGGHKKRAGSLNLTYDPPSLNASSGNVVRFRVNNLLRRNDPVRGRSWSLADSWNRGDRDRKASATGHGQADRGSSIRDSTISTATQLETVYSEPNSPTSSDDEVLTGPISPEYRNPDSNAMLTPNQMDDRQLVNYNALISGGGENAFAASDSSSKSPAETESSSDKDDSNPAVESGSKPTFRDVFEQFKQRHRLANSNGSLSYSADGFTADVHETEEMSRHCRDSLSELKKSLDKVLQAFKLVSDDPELSHEEREQLLHMLTSEMSSSQLRLMQALSPAVMRPEPDGKSSAGSGGGSVGAPLSPNQPPPPPVPSSAGRPPQVGGPPGGPGPSPDQSNLLEQYSNILVSMIQQKMSTSPSQNPNAGGSPHGHLQSGQTATANDRL